MTEWGDAMSPLTDEQAGQFFRGVLDYHKGIEPVFIDQTLQVLWGFLKPNIDRINNNYKKNIENGKKGGAPKGNKNASKPNSTQKQPNSTEEQAKTNYKEKEKEKEKAKEIDKANNIEKEDIEHIMNLKGISKSEAIQYIKSLIEDKSVQEKKVENDIFSIEFL